MHEDHIGVSCEGNAFSGRLDFARVFCWWPITVEASNLHQIVSKTKVLKDQVFL